MKAKKGKLQIIRNLMLVGIMLVLQLNTHDLFAQDLEIYKRQKNDNFVLPEVSADMTFSEFQLLERNLTMKDMLYAVVVPGYTNFYAKEFNIGYVSLGTRLVGYAGFLYLFSDGDIEFNKFEITVDNNNLTTEEIDKKLKTSQGILITASSLVISSYLFDWIYGQYMLQKKQEEIRFKYSMQLGYNSLQGLNSNFFYYPEFKIRIDI